MSTSTITEVPEEGTEYALNDVIGSSTVSCVDTTGLNATTSDCAIFALTPSVTYNFKVFSQDLAGNYSNSLSYIGFTAATTTSSSGLITLTLSDNIHFYLGEATTTLGTITIIEATSTATIATTTDLRLTIATTTTDFRFDTNTTTLTFGGTASGKVSSTVSYEDAGATLVIDVTSDFSANDTLIINGVSVGSFVAISTTTSRLALHTDGNTIGAPTSFATETIHITGSLLLSNHTLGQVSNQFSFQNKNDEVLFAFNLAAVGENATVTDMVVTLSGVQNLGTNNLTDFRLYRDNNSNRTLDGGDTLIDAAGILTINGQNGAVTFNNNFVATSSANYIVTGDMTGVGSGASVVFKLQPIGITGIGSISTSNPYIIDTLISIQHNRHNSGGGGSSAAIGGAAPAGAGEVTGGGKTGGGEAGKVPDGANITTDPNFYKPTATGDINNEWTNGNNSFLSDGVYATAGTANLRQSYNGFKFGIPLTNTIQGISVKLDASGTTANGTIDVAISWDAGASYTTAKATPTFTGTDVVYTVGGTADTWGRMWTAADFSSANFRLRVTAQPSANTIQLDALEVRIFHQAGGGGAGGGGEI